MTEEIGDLIKSSLKEINPTIDDFIIPIVTISGYTGEKII